MTDPLFAPLELPCGVILKNRLAKSAMSDSLGDGRGDPTDTQARLYERWAEGGIALSIVGEVQGNPHVAEKPGNLVLHPGSDTPKFKALTQRGGANNTQLWAQLGHAGALAHPPISTPKGPSALDLPGLRCEGLTAQEVQALPAAFAQTALQAIDLGFGGVEVHAAHGFLLSQFLSPLFNHRTDAYGGPIAGRMRLLLDVIAEVRAALGPRIPVGVKLNATDQLEGGLTAEDALEVAQALGETSVDLIDISGGTYFPGAPAASDSGGAGPYFAAFATEARRRTRTPLMLTGGFKTRAQAAEVLRDGTADLIGLARSMILAPDLPNRWRADPGWNPTFPRFANPPEGGITAWYTLRLTELGQDVPPQDTPDLTAALARYNDRDAERAETWRAQFPPTE